MGGRYDLVREIGAGGMGRVFLARDTQIDRDVAVKVMIAGAEIDLHALLRFQQEGALLSALKHPNIVTVYGSFLEDNSAAIVMEFVEGPSLRAAMETNRLSLPRIKVIAEQVLSALAYAHSRGVVHRDIKLDNILIGPGDRVKVADFGIAHVLFPGATLNTRTGAAIGTPLYMSPEQIEGNRVDGRSDLYSLGTVMYHMLAGRPPFVGDDPLTVAFQHVHKAPPPLSQFSEDVPEDWEAVVLRALAKSPGDRYQTADAMGSAVSRLSTEPAQRPAARRKPDTIDRIIAPEITSDTSSQPAPPRVVQSTPTSNRRSVSITLPPARWLLGAGALVLLAVLGLVLVHNAGSRSGSVATSTSTASGPQSIRFLGTWGRQGSELGQLTSPYGIAVGHEGRVYVADYDNNRISVFDEAGRPLLRWILRDPQTGVFLSATDIAVRGTTVYVTDSNGNRVLKLVRGRIATSWRGNGLRTPAGVAVAGDGTVYVVDQGNNRIQVLSPTGTVIRMFGSHGSGPGNLSYPTGIAVAPNGSVFVADQGNSRIEHFSRTGAFLSSWGAPGRGRGKFGAIAGVAVSSGGYVCATDSQLARVQCFSPQGHVLAIWGRKGAGRRELREPVGIAIDQHNHAFVVDSSLDKVVKLGSGS